ncbi:hypothetical protein FNV43_RR25734 [Rhamnella rubrinervis]|uniref:THUMP domain-containing protein n=1 Tax=Rhamnella rubrinervis TaxID=2594499 RepID=A0A8K0GLU0_9ROSA|nr:hypothetical protein FNV43_RR25734 [Rhamnella rubrinervis]
MAEEGEAATQRRPENGEEETEVGNQQLKEEESSSSMMKPWEQHWGVIIIPRFDYNAPSSLLQNSHSGFLITCTIKREKSATKEAISILGKYVISSASCCMKTLDDSCENSTPKRRKTIMEDVLGECIVDGESKDSSKNSESTSNPLNDISLSTANADAIGDKNSVLSLVKLTRSGLVLFTLPTSNCFDTVNILSNIIQSLKTGSSSSPLWCHRIFPIQATCNLNEKELHGVVSKLVLEFVNDKQNTLARPLKFAVGYNRRGIEETVMKIPKDTSNASAAFKLLDRNNCFATVAAAVKEVVSDSVVDLKSPEICVLVEILPLSGVPSGSLVVAVSVLPQNLVSTKPRLCIKALVSDNKVRDRKHSK